MSKLSRREPKFTFVQYQFGQFLHNYCKITNSLFRQKLKTYYWSYNKKINTLVVVANEKQRLIKLQRGRGEERFAVCRVVSLCPTRSGVAGQLPVPVIGHCHCTLLSFRRFIEKPSVHSNKLFLLPLFILDPRNLSSIPLTKYTYSFLKVINNSQQNINSQPKQQSLNKVLI